jgi:AraC-like DNA-binding protein
VFSGTYSRSFICNALQHEAIMGVHFKAGGAFPFLDIEASELANAHANLVDLWGRTALEVREHLCAAATPQQRFRIMEETLLARLHYDTTRQLQLNHALKMFAMGGKRALVRNVSRELGFSQRRFIQMFSSQVGLTPKLFCRVQRFQHARVLAEKSDDPDWTRLALTCGYFDQSHLINDFKEFSSSTPRIFSIQQHPEDPRLKDNHVPLLLK